MREIATADEFSVVAALGSDELPEDLVDYSKKASQRAVRRLLDRTFYAPYVAAVELHKQYGQGDLEKFALFTVSSWDPSVPVPDYAEVEAEDRIERLSHFYTHPANPTDWLRRMPNNPICNIAITTGFRGPCMHYIGGADALSMITTVALSTIADGTADVAMVVAYDMPDGEHHLLAHEGDSSAAAVVLAKGAGDRPASRLVRSAADQPAGTTALVAMQSYIESTRTALVAT
ncbi:hypothetical protein LFM09_20165 [Lentzea alba]|uniref:hypothetical protein n=1 Tax=Lentzea alba TaxID=2714351 RepID=UPI0039BF738F